MKQSPHNKLAEAISPALPRRLAALFYDALMILAVLLVAAALVVLPAGLAFGYEIPVGHPLYQLYLISVWAVFFCWFWVHGGQTVGMRAWRILAIRNNGQPLRWQDALLRLFAALLLPLILISIHLYPFALALVLLNYLWPLLDRKNRSLHEILSQTRLIMLQKKQPDEKPEAAQ
ncbi:MAG: RDD family protein [gamma proteobacterium symbiont of Bathyaustriella thionipta]|nr:RDD family protein [gamma proteobacterium symbiont of Bathyaustriella thionipta]